MNHRGTGKHCDSPCRCASVVYHTLCVLSCRDGYYGILSSVVKIVETSQGSTSLRCLAEILFACNSKVMARHDKTPNDRSFIIQSNIKRLSFHSQFSISPLPKQLPSSRSPFPSSTHPQQNSYHHIHLHLSAHS